MRNLALSVVLLFLCKPIVLISQSAEPYDIMISELMIDPNPVVGLPNFEWIELYNRTNQSINLEDFLYSSGSTRYKLPAYDLAAGAYVMICDDSDRDELRTFGEAIDIMTFPSLTNGGDVATLEDPNGNWIHEVIYKKSWYGDTDKDDGGYTLELINPNDPCLAASNWMASGANSGGTPAAQNSGWMPSTPAEGLLVQSVLTLSGNEIQVSFDRIPSMNISEMDFTISPSISILDIIQDNNDARVLALSLSDNLNSGTPYTLTVASVISDCIGGSKNEEQTVDFVLPEPISTEDLLINEILFNPIGGESDYIEIYNRSNKFLDLRQLMIGNLDSDGTGSRRAVDKSIILGPIDYLVITEDAGALRSRYTSAIDKKILETDLPSFNNASGNVTLFVEDNGMDINIDAMDYDEEMHNSFIDDPEGVALERVDFDVDTNDRNNWQSGAGSTGYGSPTLPNAQRSRASTFNDNLVYLEKKTFFPQKQTEDDQLRIIFELDRSDYIGTINIYDGAGRPIHLLANNQLIGRNDLYNWNGRNEEGILMNAGVYIIVVQLVTVEGDLITKKLPCVLSRHL